MRLPEWMRVTGTRKVTRPDGLSHLLVTIDVNARPFVEGMTAASAAVHQLQRDLERVTWQNMLLLERNAARRWWLDYITAAYNRYGWEWPGPAVSAESDRA